MVRVGTSPESSLGRLAERLLSWAEISLQAGDLEQAQATAEEVRAVDPDNEQAASVLRRVEARRGGAWGERALMTLLFSDLVGSTQLSEQVEPERMADLFAFYRDAVQHAVERYGGTLVQFYGDGVLAGFGYPQAHEDDARRAVLAGLDLVVAMHDGRAELARRVGASVGVRVGIHTGRVVVTGVRGESDVLSRNSILGMTPNLAARIQGEGQPGAVVVSDVTHELVDADFFTRSLGEHALKGITRPVEIFVVDRPRYAAARFSADRYRRAGLVGREEPVERLLGLWQAVHADRAAPGATVLVAGEAGIGKSRLVVELLDRVQAGGGGVLGAGCLPYYANVPLWPVARMLERTLGVADRGAPPEEVQAVLERHLATLGLDAAAFVPVLAPLVHLPHPAAYPAPELDPSALLELTLARLVQWLAAVAAQEPHLLVVEDLHWADPSTLELLHRVATAAPPALLTVATTRDPGLVPWRDALVTLELGRLEDGAAARLVDNLSGDSALADGVRDEIVEQSDGNPLFIEELTRSCLAENRSEPMPLRLQELFTWRLKAPGIDLRTVQVAATVGPVFRTSVVGRVVGDVVAVEAQLRLLLDDGVLEQTPAEGTYRFRHALMRDAAYETQVLDVRQQTHAAVADVLAASGAEPALVATHLDLGGRQAQAAETYVAAARAAQSRGAHPEATRLLSRALEILDELPPSTGRDLAELGARMLRVFSVSSMRGYAAPEVESDHARAEVLADGLGPRPEVVATVVGIYSYRLTNGDVPTARDLTERLIAMTRDTALAWLEPEVDDCAGFAHLYLGDLARARDFFERSLAGFAARPDDADEVWPYWPLPNDPVAAAEIGLACVLALTGDRAGARDHERRAVERAEEVGFPRGPFTVGFVKTYAAWLRQFLDDEEGARRLAGEVVGVGHRYGYAYWVALGSAYLGGPPGGDPEPAFLQATVDTLRLMGHEAFLASLLSRLAQLTARAGESARARELVEEAYAVAEQTGEAVHLPEILRRRAELVGRDDPVRAAADLRRAVDVAAGQGATVSRLRAAVDLASLPEGHRPEGWRAVLAEARAAVPPAYDGPEAGTADALLAG